VERLLRSVGLNVETFVSAQEFMRHPPSGACMPRARYAHAGDERLELQQELVAAGPDLPVIFLTGHGTVSMSVRALKTGAADFLQKPVDDQVLLDAIHQAIERNRQARA
jgi:FixJ family two-component response regulator